MRRSTECNNVFNQICIALLGLRLNVTLAQKINSVAVGYSGFREKRIMIFSFIKKIASNTVYVQLSENNIKITHIELGMVYDQSPYIAIDKSNPKKEVIHSIGDEAKRLQGSSKFEVSNPFSHPRLLVSSFVKAEKILMHGIREVHQNKFFAPSPLVVMHPMEKLESGVTDIECRVYRELALGAGAREVRLHVGNALPIRNFSLSMVVEP